MENRIKFLEKIIWLIGFGLNVREMFWINMKKSSESTKKYQNPLFLNLEIWLMVAQSYIIHSIFKKA